MIWRNCGLVQGKLGCVSSCKDSKVIGIIGRRKKTPRCGFEAIHQMTSSHPTSKYTLHHKTNSQSLSRELEVSNIKQHLSQI